MSNLRSRRKMLKGEKGILCCKIPRETKIDRNLGWQMLCHGTILLLYTITRSQVESFFARNVRCDLTFGRHVV
jgi:hypothetical protein